MIANLAGPGPNPALARAVLIALTARPECIIPLHELADEAGDELGDLGPTLDAMRKAGQVVLTPGGDRVALGAGAARRLGRAAARPS